MASFFGAPLLHIHADLGSGLNFPLAWPPNLKRNKSTLLGSFKII